MIVSNRLSSTGIEPLSRFFDKYSFLRSFPRARIDQLRRKHRARILSAERGSEAAEASHGKWGAAADARAPATRPAPERRRRRRPGPTGAIPPSGTAAALGAENGLVGDDDSSSDEGELMEADEGNDANGGYDVVSFDDARDDQTKPARAFWL